MTFFFKHELICIICRITSERKKKNNRIIAVTGQQLCDTCYNLVNKLAVSGQRRRIELRIKFARNVLKNVSEEINLKKLKKVPLYDYK